MDRVKAQGPKAMGIGWAYTHPAGWGMYGMQGRKRLAEHWESAPAHSLTRHSHTPACPFPSSFSTLSRLSLWAGRQQAAAANNGRHCMYCALCLPLLHKQQPTNTGVLSLSLSQLNVLCYFYFLAWFYVFKFLASIWGFTYYLILFEWEFYVINLVWVSYGELVLGARIV